MGGIDPRMVKALTVLGFAIPVIGYLALIGHYSVNAVWADQWDDVPVIRQSFHSFPDWSSLWTQHVDNRILFPNLIVVALAHTVNYNIQVEEYLSALMLFAATALFIWSHKRRSPDTPLLFYCPVAFVTLTIAQWQNTLWGFQMAWYLVVFSLALTVALLDRPRLIWPIFVAGALAAIMGSYSSLQGLIIWPIGLVLLYHRRRPLWTIIAWIAAAGATTALYFHNFTGSQAFNPQHLLDYPMLAAKFFVFALGDVVGVQESLNQSPNGAVMAFGLLILVMAVLVLLKWGIRRDEHSGAPVGIALILFGLLFDAFITQGRIFFGFYAASQSRYTTNDIMVLAGIYLTVLSGCPIRVHAERGERAPGVRRDAERAIAWIGDALDRINGHVIRGVALAAIVIQVVLSVHYAIPGARWNHQQYVTTAYVTRNIDHEPNVKLIDDLYFVRSPEWLRNEAQFLREQHLSLFG